MTLNEVDNSSVDFFKAHSTGFLGPIRAVNELKETSLIELEECPPADISL